MELSVMTEPQMGGTYSELLALARWAEANEMGSFARSDHYYWGQEQPPDATDAFATLAGLARDTDTIRLAVLVTPITFRHPAVIAKNAATIDQMSGGRLDLGVGTGWNETEHEVLGLPFPDTSERYARLEESLQYLSAAFSPGHGRFEGRHYRLDAVVEPTPTNIHLIVGGKGPKRTPALAGTYADEYNHFMAPADEIGPKVALMRETAGDRDVTASVMGPALVGRDDSEYTKRLSEAASGRDMDPQELEERYVSRGIPVGPPTRVAETMAALEQAGVEKWYVQWLDVGDVDGFAATIEALRSA